MSEFEPPAGAPTSYPPEPYQVGAQPGHGPAPGQGYWWTPDQQGLVHPGRRRLRAGWLVAAVAAVAALGLAGYHFATSGSSGNQNAAGPSPTAPASSTEPRPGSPAALAATLQAIALQPADFRNGYTLRLVAHGDQVRGQVTLDNCGYRFTTEAHRVARRQVTILHASRDSGLSNEVVAYDSPHQAARALAQWYRAAAHCPRGIIHSSVAGVPRMRERTLRNESHVANLPVIANTVTVEAFAVPGGRHLYGVAILQRRGRYLDAVYATEYTAPNDQEIRAVSVLATLTGRRLAAAI